MKTINFLKSVSLLGLLAISLVGCSKGPKGDPGSPGALGVEGGGKVVQTINCSGTIAPQLFPYDVLDDLEVTYTAVVTASGDVYATAAVKDEGYQASSTAFYAKEQSGSATAKVRIRADYDFTDDSADWIVSLNRTTLEVNVVYDDLSLPATWNGSFAASACVREIF